MAEEDFQRDLQRIKHLSAHDRDVLLTAFRAHAQRLVQEQVRPRLEQSLQAAATRGALRDAALTTLMAANLPQRVERVEAKVDQLAEEVSGIRMTLATITERLKHMPTKVEMYIAMAALLGVMAKGFGWL